MLSLFVTLFSFSTNVLSAQVVGEADVNIAGKAGGGGILPVLPTGSSPGSGSVIPVLTAPVKSISKALNAVSIKIESPYNGSAIYERANFHSANYYPATFEVLVKGEIYNLDNNWVSTGRLVVLIDGNPTQNVSWDSQKKILSFTAKAFIHPDPLWPEKTVLVELADIHSQAVLARSQSVYLDLREADEANASNDVNNFIPGLFAQFTNSGVGAHASATDSYGLEIPNISAMPDPDLKDLNNQFESAAKAIPDYKLDDIEACIALNDIKEDKFRDELAFPALLAIKAVATADYEFYKNVVSGSAACEAVFPVLGAAICTATMEATWCVKEAPENKHFELCVHSIEGEPITASIETIDDISFEVLKSAANQDSGLIQSDVAIAGIEGRVNGKLRKMTLRWIHNGIIPCTGLSDIPANVANGADDYEKMGGPPDISVDDNFIIQHDWSNDWATCKNIEVNNDWGRTDSTISPAKSAIYEISREANIEQLSVRNTVKADFLFSTTKLKQKGTCAENFISGSAKTMANAFAGKFTGAFVDVWNGRPDQPKILDELLAPYELGAIDYADHEVIADLLPLSSNPVAGVRFAYQTLVNPVLQADSNRNTAGMLYHPARVQGDNLSGVDDDGNPFDALITLTTGYVNQKLHTLGATSRLNFNLQPSWADLGVDATLLGYQKNQAPPLNGTVLGAFNPVFAELGAQEVQIKVARVLDPIVWMSPDPPAFLMKSYGSPLSYGIEGLSVSFAEEDRIDPKSGNLIPGKIWLRALLSVVDKDFQFTLAYQQNDVNLNAGFIDERWILTIQDNNFSTCDMIPHGKFDKPGSCERLLEDELLQLVKPRIKDRMNSLVSQFPAPQFFDVQGKSGQKIQTTPVSRNNDGQNIFLYANFKEVF